MIVTRFALEPPPAGRLQPGYTLQHDVITANVDHEPNYNGVNWSFAPKLSEKVKAGNTGDTFELTGEAQHKVAIAGHAGEAANGMKVPFKIGPSEVGKVPVNNMGIGTVAGKLSIKKHTNHFDSVTGTWSFTAKANDAQSLQTYSLEVVGTHTKDEPKGGGGGMEKRTPPNLGPMAIESTLGAVAWIADPFDGSFALSVDVLGVTPGQITAARIRVGTPASPGAIAFDLVPGSFASCGPNGAQRQIPNAVFPAGQLSHLLAGNTYVEIVTAAATYTAQLSLQESVLLPGFTPTAAAVALMVLMASGAVAAWRRRRFGLS